MKKIVSGLAILLALSFMTMSLVTCDLTPIGGPDDVLGETNVFYSPDGKSLTFFLDGTTVPETRASRALTDSLARMGHDYYEVVFVNSGTTARAAWEIGQNISIKGVPRTAVGIVYSSPANAILFVGRKSDNTLLAVGSLTDARGPNNISTGTTVNSETRSVTFSVIALAAGTSLSAATSSFLTDDGSSGTPVSGETTVQPQLIGGKAFPLFVLTDNATTTGEYTINNITSYLTGIFVDGTLGRVTKREPRYPAGGGLYNYADFTIDQTTVVTLSNNKTDAIAFANPILFTLNTNGTPKSVFSVNFDIPVYAISKGIAADGGPAAETWYIRSGYGTYRFDLDDGAGGAGGCILFGSKLSAVDAIGIRTTPMP